MALAVVVAGSTGLIGNEVLKQLAGRSDLKVVALVRKQPSSPRFSTIEERVFDFSPSGDYRRIATPELPCDVLLCCVGTTIREAGSRAAFTRVDRDIPLALAASLVGRGAGKVFGFVSSTGAGKPVGFYLQTKAEAEQGILACGLRHVFVRPSLLLGERKTLRVGERIAAALMPPVMGAVSALTGRKLAAVGRLMPIEASRVAATLIRYTIDQPPATARIVEGYDFG